MKCITCSSDISVVETKEKLENDLSDASIFENLQKSLILTQLLEKQEFSVLCKFCKIFIEDYYKKEISEEELEASYLDTSIQDIMNQISDLDSIQNTDLSSNINFLNNKSQQITKEIQDAEEILKNLKTEHEELMNKQRSIEYKTLLNHDKEVEVKNHINIIEAEIEYLSDPNLLSKIFVIESVNKIGTINNMRMGRTDYELVSWEEINGAWGCSCLLLSSIFRLKQFHSQKIKLYPLGGNSRISYLKDDVNRFELFFSEFNFSNLIRRFNKAQCLFLELFKEFEEFSKETGLPYNISNEKIGNCSIIFDPNHKETWTQALRFLLQDLKYVLQKMSI